MTHPYQQSPVDMSRYPAVGNPVPGMQYPIVESPQQPVYGQPANTAPVTVHVHLGANGQVDPTQQRALPYGGNNQLVPVRVPVMPGNGHGHGNHEGRLSRLMSTKKAAYVAILAAGALIANAGFTAVKEDTYRDRVTAQLKEGEVKSFAQSIWAEVPVVGKGTAPAGIVMPAAWENDQDLTPFYVTGKVFARIEIKNLEGDHFGTTAQIKFDHTSPLTGTITGRLDDPSKTITPAYNASTDSSDYKIDLGQPDYNIQFTGGTPLTGAPIIKNGPLTKWNETDLEKINTSIDKLYGEYLLDKGRQRVIAQLAAAAVSNQEGVNPCMETATTQMSKLLISSIVEKGAAQKPPVAIDPAAEIFQVSGSINNLGDEYAKSLQLTPLATVLDTAIPSELQISVGFLDPDNPENKTPVDAATAASGLSCSITPPKPPEAQQ